MLSEREIEVLECVAEGASNKEIASRLSISQNTVKVHLRNISTKLGASSRTEAVTLGIQQGVVSVPGVVVAEPMVEKTAVIPLAPVPLPTPLTPQETVLPPRHLDWRYGAGAVLLLAVAVAVGLWFFNRTIAETPFVETPIADTHWLLSKPMPNKRANFAVAAVGL
ncbi:MAG: helix-turn-helix transcriptional regulator, partial [Anaerolineales bacterium]|nr:helix-turn-helix transcriptional regulator [Anaerolineales bacterium]